MPTLFLSIPASAPLFGSFPGSTFVFAITAAHLMLICNSTLVLSINSKGFNSKMLHRIESNSSNIYFPKLNIFELISMKKKK